MSLDLDRSQVVVLTLVRDSDLWLNAFLDHHFALGVAHVVLLDNGSRDETLTLATGDEKVSVPRKLAQATDSSSDIAITICVVSGRFRMGI